MAAGFVLTVIWLLRMKNGGRDNLRILLNCTGFSLLTAFLMPVALAGLPMIPAITALMTVIALIWVFRRPVKWAAAAQVPPRVFLGKTIRNWNSRLAVSGIIAFIALIWSYGGGWFPALTALISGGYFFAELDGELCGKRESAVEPIRFLGIAIGAFAANYMHYSGVSFWGFFAVVIALRGWSFFRS